MKEQQIINAYEIAKERYAKLGIDTDAVMETLQSVPMSMHCWQADDVTGFESQGSLTGGFRLPGIIRERLVTLRNCVQIS